MTRSARQSSAGSPPAGGAVICYLDSVTDCHGLEVVEVCQLYK